MTTLLLNCAIGTGIEDMSELFDLSGDNDVHERVYGLISHQYRGCRAWTTIVSVDCRSVIGAMGPWIKIQCVGCERSCGENNVYILVDHYGIPITSILNSISVGV